MDFMILTIELLDVIIWPVTIILVLLIFKKNISELVKRISKIETNAGKIELEKINYELKDIPIKDTSWIEEMQKIAEINPRAAIIEAWTTIEHNCIKKGFTQGSTIQRFSPKVLDDYLLKVDDSIANKVRDLRNLRNKLIHGIDSDFDYINAKKYIELADKVITILEKK